MPKVGHEKNLLASWDHDGNKHTLSTILLFNKGRAHVDSLLIKTTMHILANVYTISKMQGG
jgi:hypothetical protein